ncbi:arginine deiminase-related protein [Aestuariibacter sp. AA17]|uniref:Arginine deiminase-related protein n=1 Tax=Fluctibacter corallii TaxID=2984329 RepID=A0ABT3A8M4_9ALTE|nr:arginine deiminase-related protein [Aestuariibacter sp. AA17]MCV2884960.1 arginine deiminase-related protein [Aestuariibacter sp. AA17]
MSSFFSEAPANAVLMVPPRHFGFNRETSKDNVFQHRPTTSSERVRQSAVSEFNAMVHNLEQAKISVVIMDAHDEKHTPDAVFPNNWLTTHPSGEVLLYPMHTPNRQAEVKPKALKRVLNEAGYAVNQLMDVATLEAHCSGSLEGTGAMVFDHTNQRIFTALSERCDNVLLERLCHYGGVNDYITFDTQGSTGTPIYHTNVLMSIGPTLAIVCKEAIVKDQRARVMKALNATHDVMEISMAQMETQFCGNILAVKNRQNETYWVMSSSAYHGMSASQQAQLKEHGLPVVSSIETIERVGGGSCRCMVAEIFLPIL